MAAIWTQGPSGPFLMGCRLNMARYSAHEEYAIKSINRFRKCLFSNAKYIYSPLHSIE